MGARTRRVAAIFAVLAVSLVGGGVVLGLVSAPVLPAAGAATCTSAGGVSVVVDYRELGGGVTTACATDGGGRSATAIFASVGVSLTYAQRQPGFVCRVNGQPASDPCVNTSPADAYWGLWWSDGSKSSWTYSSYSSGSLTVPAGGSVGWAWQQDRASSGAAPPQVAPPVHATTSPSPTSSPTSSPSPSPTSSPSTGGSGSGGGSQPSPSPSSGSSPASSPSSSPSAAASGDPSESPLASESPGASRSPAGPGQRDKKRSGDRESPGDSRPSDGDDPTAEPLESPGDSTAGDAPSTRQPAADGPTKVPAFVTWGAVGLLGAAVAASALVARRRRESGAS